MPMGSRIAGGGAYDYFTPSTFSLHSCESDKTSCCRQREGVLSWTLNLSMLAAMVPSRIPRLPVYGQHAVSDHPAMTTLGQA